MTIPWGYNSIKELRSKWDPGSYDIRLVFLPPSLEHISAISNKVYITSERKLLLAHWQPIES